MSYSVTLFHAPGHGIIASRAEMRDIATLDEAIKVSHHCVTMADPQATPMSVEIHDADGQLVLSYTGGEQSIRLDEPKISE